MLMSQCGHFTTWPQLLQETKELYQSDYVISIGSREEEGAIARGLYKILRDFDHLQVDVIYAESFEKDKMGDAIMNRLLKAAGYLLEYAQ